jgi:hypothetical protein
MEMYDWLSEHVPVTYLRVEITVSPTVIRAMIAMGHLNTGATSAKLSQECSLKRGAVHNALTEFLEKHTDFLFTLKGGKYELTQKGRDAVNRWLNASPPLFAEIVGHLVDAHVLPARRRTADP